MMKIINKIPTPIYLWIAVIIFAASNSITRVIVDLGKMHLVEGRNPISFCNLLFVGNICGLGMMLFIFYKEWQIAKLKKITKGDWLNLTIISILSGTIVPSLIFSALNITSVTNVVLIGRLQSPLTLAFGIFLLGSRIHTLTVAGSIVSFVGVTVTIFFTTTSEMLPIMGEMFSLDKGSVFAAMGSILGAFSTVMGQKHLKQIPLGIFSVFRNFIGTIVFFILANVLYGAQHFAEVFSLFLWQWMLVYAFIIVVVGQLSWLAALRGSTTAQVIFADSCNPIIAIFMAYLFLKEAPTNAQILGGSIILIGIVLSFFGNIKQKTTPLEMVRNNPVKSDEIMGGFKGM